MIERKLTGKLKIFKKINQIIIASLLAIIVSIPFLMVFNTTRVAFAENQTIENQKQIEVVSALNASRKKNKSLIKIGTSEIYDIYNYIPNTNSSGKNLTINLNINQISFDQNESLFMWMFIPSVILSDLIVSVSDVNGNSLEWRIEGSETSNDNEFNLSLSEILTAYDGQISRGWKLIEFSRNDAIAVGNELENIDNILVCYSFVNLPEQIDNSDFEVGYSFVAKAKNLTSQVVDKQEYVVYAEKENFLETQNSIYIGDKVIFQKISDFFSYVIVGKQNILENSSGYVWNIKLSTPSGTNKTLTLLKLMDMPPVGKFCLPYLPGW